MFVSFVVITSYLQAYLLWSLSTRVSMPETCGFALYFGIHEQNLDTCVGEIRFYSPSKKHVFLACEALLQAQGRRSEG